VAIDIKQYLDYLRNCNSFISVTARRVRACTVFRVHGNPVGHLLIF
jgi:hypothetical protein